MCGVDSPELTIARFAASAGRFLRLMLNEGTGGVGAVSGLAISARCPDGGVSKVLKRSIDMDLLDICG